MGSFPARSVRTLAFRGQNASLAMRGIQRLARACSSLSVSQNALPPRSGGQRKHRRNTASSATVSLLLGQLCFSEWSLVASFPGFSSLLLIFCPLRSPSLWIYPAHEQGVQFCTTFAHPIKD